MSQSHDQLCERARRWLSGTRRCDPVFSGIASCAEIPDAIGWSSCGQWYGSTVIECKTSRTDFYADKKKSSVWRPKAGPDSDVGSYGSMEWRFSRNRMTPGKAEELGYELLALPRMGNFRFFMCERESGITPELLEKHAPDHGLIYVDGARRVTIAKPAIRREVSTVDKGAEIRYLRFAIINGKRRFELGDELPEYEAEGIEGT